MAVNPSTSCIFGQTDERASRYAAGTLSTHETAAFEEHLLLCDSCQEAVRQAVLIRAAVEMPSARKTRRKVAALVVAAAAVAGIVMLRPADPVLRLGEIGSVVPGFEGMPVRVGDEGAASQADRGMAAYLEQDFAHAEEFLSEAAASDPTPGVHFFLGITRMRLGDTGGAADALRAATRPVENPYAEEARFYLAKAHLARGEPDRALQVLDDLAGGGGPAAPHARALADSVRSALR